MSSNCIVVKGATQNNLKGLDLELPLHELIVVTGVSGSGKSSLAFDTVYSEGQRRYVETFSPYARQFLDRMDKPRAERIEGIPPAIAIDQTNPVRTSRSTVGTMTELNDHLKLLFARVGQLYCGGCGREVRRDDPQATAAALIEAFPDQPRALVSFEITVPENFEEAEVRELLARQGYTRIHRQRGTTLEVVQDRLRLSEGNRGRLVEALESALIRGSQRATVHVLDDEREVASSRRFSSELHCADCNIAYPPPTPNMFSFNSPIGACESCRGFGRTMGIDYDLVIPDGSLSLAGGAIKPLQSKSFRGWQSYLLRCAEEDGVDVSVPWKRLSAAHKRWVLTGEGAGANRPVAAKAKGRRRKSKDTWGGAQQFFAYLERKSYKMHVRVMLSKYRSYDACADCKGARLKPQSLLWRVGNKKEADAVLAPQARFKPAGTQLSAAGLAKLPGLNLHDVTQLSLDHCAALFESIAARPDLDDPAQMVLEEILTRLRYLLQVGLGYLSLDRQSRTLSGGEVQRINLTTALGTSLVNALFVLDEPSIGLHARDVDRLVGVLHRLRDSGNSLLVVEHDRDIMLAADRVLDMGPGPGEHGGQIVYEGSPARLLKAKRSRTAKYLRGELRAQASYAPARRPFSAPPLKLMGASAHNLKNVDVAFPLGQLVCITGVSGSGKSTLMHDVLYRALRKLQGRPLEAPGEYKSIKGHQRLDDVVLIDQSAIGKTTRSNPASYVGALTALRKWFAAQPLAQARGYNAGFFSFNSGDGRCPACSGSGFEHVEMQFLSDVYLSCPECDGRRYRPQTLEVKITGVGEHADRRASIADVLDMSGSEALAFFAGKADVERALAPLVEVGLGYMKLGQAVPTLSGGEAQRLKLAGHLAEALKRRARRESGRKTRKDDSRNTTLYLFDEPTTGLHFDDISVLLAALARLVEDGGSLLVIEHNLDVIAAADWVIDMGPEGGDAGGEIVFEGTPANLVKCRASHTGQALAQEKKGKAPTLNVTSARVRARHKREQGRRPIQIRKAREHNLRNIDVDIPRDRFTVITGVSGSGKSTVAFDILFGEGQRRYLESLNAYARQFVQPSGRPDVDGIFGIPPTVAIEQRTSRGGRKSTVATMTELYHFLRLIFVKLGTQHCPDCHIAIEPQTADSIIASVMKRWRGKQVTLLSPLVVARKGYYTDLAKWAANKGYAHLRVDGQMTPTDNWPRLKRFQEHDIDLPVATLKVAASAEAELRAGLTRAIELGGGLVRVALKADANAQPVARAKKAKTKRTQAKKRSTAKPVAKVDAGAQMLYSTHRSCPGCSRSFAELDPRLFSYNSRHGWCEDCFGTGLYLTGFDEEQTGEEAWWTSGWEGVEGACEACDGKRLNPEALSVLFREQSIADLAAMPVAHAERFFRTLRLNGRDGEIARDILSELRSRLQFLCDVGLSYLQLDRAAPTLSGGEAQRLRLASQLGSNLRGVCYILDEPTIGLHARDNSMLLNTLERLESKGNTVVVVEHDEDTIRRAQHVIDLGPGAGVRGGEVVAQGTPAQVARVKRSVTGQFLANPLKHPLMPGRGKAEEFIRIEGARMHNLKGFDIALPLRRLVCVSGVSGSGKSTLIRGVLHDNLSHQLSLARKGKGKGKRKPSSAKQAALGCVKVSGLTSITRVLEVDQTPIGKTPRSCPATYVGVWNYVRKLYADTPEARMRGYGPGRFSFNVKGGRCEGCEGQGMRRVEMSFLPDVKVKCEVCNGGRFARETLAVRYKEHSIADVLAMSVDDAVTFFAAHPKVHHTLTLLQDVGLGYLSLGQQSPTLSGGEAQRIKLVTELAKAPTREQMELRAALPGRRMPLSHTLYILDEPTIGLHMADVEKLIRVLHRLVDAGNTVIIIEHNLDIIAEADWIVDLGPEGGDAGGRVVAKGTPAQVAARKRATHTGQALKEFLQTRQSTG